MPKIGIVIGSPRRESFNRTLALAAANILRENGSEVVEIEFSELPLMNQDIEFPVRADVAAVRQQVKDVDALWFFTPQYNDSTTAYLKNFLDWVSRRDTPTAAREEAVIYGKPATVSGISGPAATQRARAEVSHVAGFIGAKVMEDHQAGLVLPMTAWTEGVYEPSDEDLNALRLQAQAFLSFIEANA